MVYADTTVDVIGASGSVWVGYKAVNAIDLFFETLREAEETVQISSFTMGHKTEEMDEFFGIIEELLRSPHMKISIIVNDDSPKGKKKNPSLSDYSRKRLKKLEKKYPDQFYPSYFLSKKTSSGLGKILHAKLTVVDRTTALIGSANISKTALESNYEIMIKITGEAAADISAMLTRLADRIREKKV